MNHVLLNRDNIVVDVLPNYVRYIKLQSSNGITVACEENEGTGVIGSDCDTHYTLIKADMNSSPDAVRVMAVEDLPSTVIAGYSKYNPATGEFEPRYTLAETQTMKQEENKVAFANYLASHPMTWVDGKEYGVTQEDQSEISLNLNQYQIAVAAGVDTPTLEWHAKHEECAPWTVENLTALSLAIAAQVYPIYHLMQQYKTAIYSASTIEEVEAIKLQYGDEEEVIEETNNEDAV